MLVFLCFFSSSFCLCTFISLFFSISLSLHRHYYHRASFWSLLSNDLLLCSGKVSVCAEKKSVYPSGLQVIPRCEWKRRWNSMIENKRRIQNEVLMRTRREIKKMKERNKKCLQQLIQTYCCTEHAAEMHTMCPVYTRNDEKLANATRNTLQLCTLPYIFWMNYEQETKHIVFFSCVCVYASMNVCFFLLPTVLIQFSSGS